MVPSWSQRRSLITSIFSVKIWVALRFCLAISVIVKVWEKVVINEVMINPMTAAATMASTRENPPTDF